MTDKQMTGLWDRESELKNLVIFRNDLNINNFVLKRSHMTEKFNLRFLLISKIATDLEN